MIVIKGSEKSNCEGGFKLQSSGVSEKCSKRKDVVGLLPRGLLPTGFGKS